MVQRRSFLFLAMALPVLLMSGASGCKTDSKPANAIRVATDATYFPFEFQKDGQIQGFDIDLFRAIGREMGRPVEFTHTPFDTLIAGLKTGHHDAVIACLTITEERKKEVDFSDPYYDAGQIVSVRKDEDRIKGEADIKGRKVGAQQGTTGATAAASFGAEVALYDSIDLAFQDLLAGRIDAVINDEPTSRQVAETKGGIKLVGEPFTREQYAIAVRKGDKALLDEINRALAKLRAAGEIQKLREKWLTRKQ